MFFHAFLHGSSRFSGVDFTACAWYLVDYAILLVGSAGSFDLTSRDLSVVSDLKTVPRVIMPRDKDCHPLQSIQLLPYVHLRSDGKFTWNLLKSGEKIA